MSITDIGKDAAQNTGGSSGGSQDSTYESFDVSGLPFVKPHPTVAVTGELVALRYFADQNDPDRGYIGVVLDNPGLYSEDSGYLTLHDDEGEGGQQIVQSNTEGGDDYKVVNTKDDDTEINALGSEFGGRIFKGDPVDAFEEDRIVLKLSGGTGRSVASCLDVKGRGAADVKYTGETFDVDADNFDDSELVGEDDLLRELDLNEYGYPQHNGGLIEYDNDGDEYPRYSRSTQARPDLEGEEIAIMLQRLAEVDPDYEGDSYWATVLDLEGAIIGEDHIDESQYVASNEDFSEVNAPVDVSPTDAFEPSEELMNSKYNGYLNFTWPSEDVLNYVRLENGFDELDADDGDGE